MDQLSVDVVAISRGRWKDDDRPVARILPAVVCVNNNNNKMWKSSSTLIDNISSSQESGRQAEDRATCVEYADVRLQDSVCHHYNDDCDDVVSPQSQPRTRPALFPKPRPRHHQQAAVKHPAPVLSNDLERRPSCSSTLPTMTPTAAGYGQGPATGKDDDTGITSNSGEISSLPESCGSPSTATLSTNDGVSCKGTSDRKQPPCSGSLSAETPSSSVLPLPQDSGSPSSTPTVNRNFVHSCAAPGPLDADRVTDSSKCFDNNDVSLPQNRVSPTSTSINTSSPLNDEISEKYIATGSLTANSHTNGATLSGGDDELPRPNNGSPAPTSLNKNLLRYDEVTGNCVGEERPVEVSGPSTTAKLFVNDDQSDLGRWTVGPLDADQIQRIELFYSSHATQVCVSRCLACVYLSAPCTASEARRSFPGHGSPADRSCPLWQLVDVGVPVLVVDTGEGCRRRRLHVVLADPVTGFMRWRETVDHLTEYGSPVPGLHTLRTSLDHARLAAIRFQDDAQATRLMDQINRLTSDPSDSLLNIASVAPAAVGGLSRRQSTSRRNRKSTKATISSPCCFSHVTRLDRAEVDSVLLRCRTSSSLSLIVTADVM